MRDPDTNIDHHELALRALVWTLADPARALRLLDTTGLTPTELKAGAGRRETLAATLAFLEAHEPDLLAAADELGVAPQALVAARQALEA